MNKGRHLLYISDVVPGSGLGGSVIIDRHLRRLAVQGWSLTVVAPIGQTVATGPWRVVLLPSRRWWWPPFRPARPWLAALRAWSWRHELHRAGVSCADRVLTVCWGSLSWLAASVASTWDAPLISIVHDGWRETGSVNDALVGRHACRVARTVFAVSKEMQTELRAECARKIDLLYPISSNRTHPFVSWRSSFAQPAVAHVGSLHPYHAPFLRDVATRLAKVGGRLLLVSPRNNLVAEELDRACPNLVRQNFFPKNSEALDWVAAQASAVVVMYPGGLDAAGRAPTGFPSRFVEFSQLGLPILLCAPPGNPVRSWAEARGWTGQSDPSDQASLDRWVRSITRHDSWENLAGETRTAAITDFDPERIHALLVASLTAQVDQR